MKIIETAPSSQFTASLSEAAFAELDPSTVHWTSSDSNIVGVTTNPDKRTATIDVNVRGIATIKVAGNTLDGEAFRGSLAFFSGLDSGELDIELGEYVEYVEPVVEPTASETSPEEESVEGGDTQRDGISLTGVDNKDVPPVDPPIPPADPAAAV